MPGWVLAIFVIFGILLLVFGLIIPLVQKSIIKDKINSLANNELEMSVNEFFKMRNKSFGGRGSPQYVKSRQFSGVYILYNKTKNMYYVGQAKYIFDRVNAHFTGKGNGDVYVDYKYGDEFTIKMISLEKSGYNSLNELERHTIMTYNAFSKGYNKTRGNF